MSYKKTSTLIHYYFKICFLVLGLYTSPVFAQNSWQKFGFSQAKMGSPFSIVVYSKDSIGVSILAQKAYQLVDSLNLIYSDYLPQSELSLLTQHKTQPIKVSNAMIDILQRSQKAYQLSHGAFDITIGPLVKLWRQARKAKVFPADSLILQAQNRLGFGAIVLDTANQWVYINKPNMQLDLGGIAKGYIAQQVVNYFMKAGFPRVLVDAGGDIATGQAPPDKTAWSIGVNMPESEQLMPKMLKIQNASVATSGDMYQYVEIKGQKYSHIVNPATGLGLTHQRNVTVIAPDGATADWLATACSVLSVKKAMRLVNQIPHSGVLITEIRKGKIMKWTNRRFNQWLL